MQDPNHVLLRPSIYVSDGRRVVACVGSLLLPGAGQIALGHPGRAFLMLIASFALIFLPAIFGIPTLMLLALPASLLFRIYTVWDAYQLESSPRQPSNARLVSLWLQLVGACLFFAFVGRDFFAEAFRVPSGSMMPAIQPGDHVLARKLGWLPERGDAVAFKSPRDPKQSFIKRIIAMGGDSVQFCGGQVVVNGNPLRRERQDGPCTFSEAESDGMPPREIKCVAYREWIGESSYSTIFTIGDGAKSDACDAQFTVPANQFFLLGDNRENSLDSRQFGAVPREGLQGRAWYIYFSRDATGIHWSRINKPL